MSTLGIVSPEQREDKSAARQRRAGIGDARVVTSSATRRMKDVLTWRWCTMIEESVGKLLRFEEERRILAKRGTVPDERTMFVISERPHELVADLGMFSYLNTRFTDTSQDLPFTCDGAVVHLLRPP